MRKIERITKNNNVNFDKQIKGGVSMFKTIGKGISNVAKNSKVNEAVETKIRERKVKKIIKQVEKEKEEKELRAIVDFVMDSVEKDEDVMTRLEKLKDGDVEFEKQLEEEIKEVEKLTGLNKEGLDETVNFMFGWKEKLITKKNVFKKKTEQTEESEAYKEGKKIVEDMKDKIHDIFPVDPSSRFVGRFANKKKKGGE